VEGRVNFFSTPGGRFGIDKRYYEEEKMVGLGDDFSAFTGKIRKEL